MKHQAGMYLAVLLLSLLGAQAVDQEGLCGRRALQSCLSRTGPLTTRSYWEISMIANDTHAHPDFLMLRLPQPEHLNMTCRDFAKMEGCMEQAESWCDDAVRSTFEGIRASYQYLCGYGRQVFLSHAECLSSANLTLELHECSVDYSMAVAALHEHDDDDDNDDDNYDLLFNNGYQPGKDGDVRFCNVSSQLESCVHARAAAACSPEAALFWQTFAHNKLKFVASDNKCVVEGESMDSLLGGGRGSVCADGSDVLLPGQRCDGHAHCADASDESGCEGVKDKGRMTYVVMGVAGGTLALALVIVLVIKVVKNNNYILRQRRQGDRRMLVTMDGQA